MARKSRQVNAYIAKAQPFARPILSKVRKLFHQGCPELEEKLKWGHPSFEYKGMLGGMASFKKHVAWGLWKASLLNDPHGIMTSDASSPMGAGKPADVSQLPADKLILDLITQAVELNDRGVKLPLRSGQKKKSPPRVPADLATELKKNAKAAAVFEEFSPSNKREYVEWVTGAKQEGTRKRRLAQAIEWISQGKLRNWKYMNC